MSLVPKSHPNKAFHGNSFYKIIYPDDETDDTVIIPRDFIERVGIKSPKVATLLGPCGSVQRVKLQKLCGEVAFGNGWEAFFAQNAFKTGDFVLFTHSGNFQFSVQVFDETTIKKF